MRGAVLTGRECAFREKNVTLITFGSVRLRQFMPLKVV